MTTWMVVLLTVLSYQMVCFVVWLLTDEEEIVAIVATAPFSYASQSVSRLYRFLRLKYVRKHYALYSFMKRGENGANQIATCYMKKSLEAKFCFDNSADFFMKKCHDGTSWKSLPDKWSTYKEGDSFHKIDITPWMK